MMTLMTMNLSLNKKTHNIDKNVIVKHFDPPFSLFLPSLLLIILLKVNIYTSHGGIIIIKQLVDRYKQHICIL